MLLRTFNILLCSLSKCTIYYSTQSFLKLFYPEKLSVFVQIYYCSMDTTQNRWSLGCILKKIRSGLNLNFFVWHKKRINKVIHDYFLSTLLIYFILWSGHTKLCSSPGMSHLSFSPLLRILELLLAVSCMPTYY